MKKFIILNLTLIAFWGLTQVSCNSSKDNNNGGSIENTETNFKNRDKLIVENDGIPVYATPEISNPEFVLNRGAECKIIERGSFASIMDIEDFWYHIDYNGKKGWIFGEFTSMRQSSDFEVFLREFNKNNPDTLSRRFSIAYLNGMPGFKPLEYRRLDGEHYAALFYNDMVYPNVEMLVMIYQSGKPLKEEILFKGDISNCKPPHATFTSQNFIKFTNPSCSKDISPIVYFQIMNDFDIKQVKSSIITKTSKELVPAIKRELATLDESVSDDCKCTVHSSIKEAYATKDFIFYTVTCDKCSTGCNTSNSSLIAMPDSAGWMVKFEEPGGFKAIYESGIKGKYILVMEELNLQQIVRKSLKESIFLFDPIQQSLKKLNVDANSCILLSPSQYGCDFCKNNTTHVEELIFKGNPVTRVIKKISNLNYDNTNNCELTGQNSTSETYNWIPEKATFEKVN